MNTAPLRVDDEPLIGTATIANDLDLKPRAINKWVKRGDFPPPDAILNGRQLWRRSTYAVWKKAALTGRFAEPSSRASAA